MAIVNNNSIRNFLREAFKKLRLTENMFSQIRTEIDKAQYHCCSVVTIYWADTPGSRAIPSAYQLEFRPQGGGDTFIIETKLDGPNPQVLKLPENLQFVNVVLKNIVPQTSPLGEFSVVDNENGEILNDGDATGNYSTDRAIATIYIISTVDGGPI